MVIIVCGVSGVGKSTVGELLARDLRWKFYEADDFHPASNIEKMKAGISLTDEDRRPWLDGLRQLIERCLDAKENAVLACSALKKAYRDRLRVGDQVRFVFLRASKARVAQQIRQRHDHFMPPDLLDSQFADLEEPQSDEQALTVELEDSPRDVAYLIKTRLSLEH